MKIESTTFYRKLDNAGRIIIPSKLREKYRIDDNTMLQYHIIKDEQTNKCFLGFEVYEPIESTETLNALIKQYGFDTTEELKEFLDQVAQK